MMIELVWDEPFLRILKKWKKKHPNLIGKLEEKLNLFCSEPFHPSLKTHRLSGNLKDFLDLEHNLRTSACVSILSKNKALLIDLGTDDNVY